MIVKATNTGNVGIGTTTPSEKLDVVGNINFTGRIYVDNNTDVGGFGKLIKGGSSSDTSGSFLIDSNEFGVVYLHSRTNGNDHGRISAHLVGGAYTLTYAVTLGEQGAADVTHSVSIAGSGDHTVSFTMDDTTGSEALDGWEVIYTKLS